MSVLVSKRELSKVQFIETSRELYIHTLSYTKKFPKTYTFSLTMKVLDLSETIMREVIIANRFYPKTKLDVDERYVHFKNALGCLDALDNLLGITRDTIDKTLVSTYGWVHWGELIDEETNLINSVIKSDKERIEKDIVEF